MTRLCARIVAALVVLSATWIAATAAGSAPVSASQSTAADSGAERARLVAMCGTWDVEVTLWVRPGGAGVATQGASTITPLFNGLFIEEKIEASLNGAPFTTLAWTGFNTATHQYEATRIASTNPGRIAETGGCDEKMNQFELKAEYALAGETWRQRTVIQPLSADTMAATSYLSVGSGPEWKGVEIKYTRKPK